MRSFPVYLFDVDGTLTHSANDICGAIQCVVQPHLDGRTVTDQFLTTYIGRHLVDLFSHLFPAWTAQQIEDLIVEYRTHYASRGHSATTVYPGVAEALTSLPGRKATATTKGTPTTRIVLEKFGLLPFFDHVQGTDGFPAKPEPDVLLRSMKALSATPADCLFIGDSPADMEAGRRAGVQIAAVSYGYGDRKELARFAPDYWIDDLRQLIPN